MPLSNDEIKKGLPRKSLEYKILKFLEKAKNTDTSAYSTIEIMEAFGVNFGKDITIQNIIIEFVGYWAYQRVIDNLLESKKIVPISVKGDPTTYYMAK